MQENRNVPAHVAIIMDGNGRWAKKRKLPRVMGHNAGMKAMKQIVKRASTLGIKYLTVYAFSTENWKRSKEEVDGIFKLLIQYVDSELAELNENNVKVCILGDYKELPEKAVERLEKSLSTTEKNDGMQFNIALNYGSRSEMVRSVRAIGEEIKAGRLLPEEVDEKIITANLYTGEGGIPDPDLLIRTSGEQRFSNFLLWQLAYSEVVFNDVLWPDYTPEEFEKDLEKYYERDRRFGGR